jgi:hypothetical protein
MKLPLQVILSSLHFFLDYLPHLYLPHHTDALGLIAHLIDRLCISIADASLALAKSSASALLELIQAVGASPRVPPRTWLVAWPQVSHIVYPTYYFIVFVLSIFFSG